MIGLGMGVPQAAMRARRDDAARAVIARMAVPPDAQRREQIAALVQALKQGGVWRRLHALWVLAAHDAQAARLNWVGERWTLAEVAAPAFTPHRGYAGDGVASHLDTGFTPGDWPSRDSASLAVWSLTPGADQSPAVGLVRYAPEDFSTAIWPRFDADHDLFFGRMNQEVGSQIGIAHSDGAGLFAVDRSDATTIRVYHDGALRAVNPEAPSVAPLGEPLWIGGANGGVTGMSTREIAACAIGDHLNEAQHGALYAALAGYLTAVGAH